MAAIDARSWSGSMLPVVWHLEVDGQIVDNVEGLCRKVLNRAAAGLSPPLEQVDYEESLAHLLGEVAIIASERWPPRRARYPRLGAYLAIALPSALIDYWRSYHGRGGFKRVCSLPNSAEARTSEPADDSLEAHVEEYVVGYLDVHAALLGGIGEMGTDSPRNA